MFAQTVQESISSITAHHSSSPPLRTLIACTIDLTDYTNSVTRARTNTGIVIGLKGCLWGGASHLTVTQIKDVPTGLQEYLSQRVQSKETRGGRKTDGPSGNEPH